jgi:hypothetical protein
LVLRAQRLYLAWRTRVIAHILHSVPFTSLFTVVPRREILGNPFAASRIVPPDPMCRVCRAYRPEGGNSSVAYLRIV